MRRNRQLQWTLTLFHRLLVVVVDVVLMLTLSVLRGQVLLVHLPNPCGERPPACRGTLHTWSLSRRRVVHAEDELIDFIAQCLLLRVQPRHDVRHSFTPQTVSETCLGPWFVEMLRRLIFVLHRTMPLNKASVQRHNVLLCT